MRAFLSVACIGFFLFFAGTVLAADPPVVINNNNQNSANRPAQPTQQCGGGNQNDVYDPRVPPAGAYDIKHADGSSEQLYTTGEKKPYYVDDYCNQTTSPYVQPNIWVGGGGHRR